MIGYDVEFDMLLDSMVEWKDLLCFINFLVVDNYKNWWVAILLKYVFWWMCKYWWLLICEMKNVVELKWFYVVYVS
jgi:hypothetical protein